VAGNESVAMNPSPVVRTPPWSPPATPASPQAARPDYPSPGGPAAVPSCVLTGQTLHNFALNDLNGQPWEYARNRRGKLVLLDFWETGCVPCLHAIPHLNILQQRYGAYGLEVIGIAYETGSPIEQTQKVNRVRQRLQVTYALLLGGDKGPCPVQSQFGVTLFPTLVLLDESGRIVWRSVGLSPQQRKELEIIIGQRLGVR
jgi:thiol-disulfide isomerase/thioredoxin